MRNLIEYKKELIISLSLLAGVFLPMVASPLTVAAATNEVPVCSGTACETFIDKYINPFIVLLTILVGVLGAISIIVGGIQYATSADDPSKVTKAKSRILNTIIGLVAYIFLFAFLNYIIPGGLV